jgi:hypothetical protein
MKTTGVSPEAFAASISRFSRSEIDGTEPLPGRVRVKPTLPKMIEPCERVVRTFGSEW